MFKTWAIVESDECCFYLMDTNSTEHLFWYCYVVSDFWRLVKKSVPYYGIKFPT